MTDKTYTVMDAAVELDVDTSRVQKLCRQGRLGYTLPKHGRAWVITQEEIEKYKAIGPLKPPGRPPKAKLVRIKRDGTPVYETD
jgi:hypothetical protein